MVFLFACLTSETSQTQTDYRNALMRLFFRDITPDGLRLLIQKDFDMEEVTNFCEWVGVKCHQTDIREVHYELMPIGNFDPHALPHSTRRVFIIECQQDFALQTRSLPRFLETLNLGHNNIYGSLDLTTLPPNLVEVHLWGNRLRGPIFLTHLPRKLKTLWITNNCFEQKTVWYGNLPPVIEKIVLEGRMGKKHFKEVRAVDPMYPVTNKDIFQNMRPKNVH